MERLSLEDLAAIASAPEGTNCADLARHLGRPYITVAVAAWRMSRAGGWLCRITWRTCAVCNGSLASGPNNRRVHPGCQPARTLALRRRRRRQRQARAQALGPPASNWSHLSAEQRADRVAGNRRRIRHDQALTLAAATRAGAPWTPEDDEYLVRHWEQAARDQALALGRTLWSVRRRRSMLAAAAPAAPALAG